MSEEEDTDNKSEDDLARMHELVEADPVAKAAYEDALGRNRLLDELVRARGDLTQVEVARRMGSVQSQVSDLECGRVDPRLSTLQRYARAVGSRLEVRVGKPTVPVEFREALEELWGEIPSIEHLSAETIEVAQGNHEIVSHGRPDIIPLMRQRLLESLRETNPSVTEAQVDELVELVRQTGERMRRFSDD